MESIRHSSLVDDPRGVPSSKYARRYQPPSQACASMLARSSSAWLAARAREARRLPGRAARSPNRRRFSQQEPGQPDALSLALVADEVHPIVPVAAFPSAATRAGRNAARA